MADTITITSPVEFQTYQRDGVDQADIPITGTYTGAAPASVQGNFNGAGWTTLDDPVIGGGNFAGTLSAQAAGSGTLQVRDGVVTATTDSVDNIRIGDIFLVGPAQSNGVGTLTNTQSYTESEGASMFREDDAWAALADPTDSDVVTGSVWPLVANYITVDTGYPVAFITAGEGGVGITNWVKGQAAYTNVTTQVSDSAVNDLAGILYYVGESDAINGQTYYNERSWFESIVSDLLNDLSVSCPVIAANIADMEGYCTADEIDTIRKVLMDAWDDNDDVYAGPHGYDQDLAGLHWATNAEAATLAERWWAAIKEHCFNGTAGSARGPRISSYTLDNSTTVTVTWDKTLTDPGGAYTADLFVVNGVAAQAAVYGSSTTTTLTLSSGISSIDSLTYAAGHSGTGSTVVTGNDTYTLPAEPYLTAENPHYSSLFLSLQTGATVFATQGEQVLFSTVDESQTNQYIKFGIDNSGKPFVEYLNGGATVQRATGEALSNSTTYVIAFVFNGTAWTIRVNGSAHSLTGSCTRAFKDIYGRDHCSLGAHHLLANRSDAEDFFEGYIVEVRGYDSELSAGKVSKIEEWMADHVGVTL